ncbi:hypothetical protein DN051_15985 [Streptomyces cadmiisoli]|uniref:Uncharacterized protein n=1 Tax=Streptomyces cadmiisoli TaxID=2184053 RepID=A0A2Z4J0I2_9ACTN|nr:hypothetical protein DN051_15985 [Streptomyces cadmiisoli]
MSTTPVSTSEVPTMSAPLEIRGGPKRARVQAKSFAVTVTPPGASSIGIEENTSTRRSAPGVRRRRAADDTGAKIRSRGRRRLPRRCQRTRRSPRASWVTNSMVAVPSSTTTRSRARVMLSSSCT